MDLICCVKGGNYVNVILAFSHLVNGMSVGGFGGCCGTIRPRLIGRCCEMEISPAERREITPGPLAV